MAQVWECVRCNFATWEPKEAGDHERKFYGDLITGSRDRRFWLEGSPPLHFMDDIGE